MNTFELFLIILRGAWKILDFRYTSVWNLNKVLPNSVRSRLSKPKLLCEHKVAHDNNCTRYLYITSTSRITFDNSNARSTFHNIKIQKKSKIWRNVGIHCFTIYGYIWLEVHRKTILWYIEIKNDIAIFSIYRNNIKSRYIKAASIKE